MWFTLRTVRLTVFGSEDALPSLTTSWNVSTVVAVTSGAMNTGCAEVAPVSVTAGPSFWVHT